MCTISNKLKLCTCKTKEVYNLKHFWVLHRWVKGKNEMVLGQPVLPYYNSLVDIKLNKNILLTLLNEGNIFDFDIELKDKDLLHIAFKYNDDDWQHHDYGFEFKKGKWRDTEYDALTWMWHHEEFKYGKIKNAIEK